MPDTTLVVVWLVFAHLVADFVLQNDWIAINKGNGTREGHRALLTHGLHVCLCLLPAVFAFGAPGLVYLLVVAISHVFVDRWNVKRVAPGHCTGEPGFAALQRVYGRDCLYAGLGTRIPV